MTDTTTSARQAITARLNEYLDFPHAPHGAVLIDGAWGAGKTYFLKSFFKDRQKKNPTLKFAYISMYGLKSAADIDRALIAALFPLLEHKASAFAGKLLNAGLGFFRIKHEFSPEDLLSTNADVYVFDDLERCEMELNAALGYINQLVEHEEKKVVIVANQAEIPGEEKYLSRKEKLVGQTFHLTADFKSAFSKFVEELPSSRSKVYLLTHASTVHQIYELSGLDNLRLLRQAIWDFDKYFGGISEAQFKRDAAVFIVFKMFFAVSFELRAGRLQEADLMLRNPWRHFRAKDDMPTALDIAQKRYTNSVNLDDTSVPVAPIVATILKGTPGENVAASLEQSYYFQDPEKEPSWRTIWSFIEREDKAVELAIKQLEADFEARKFVAPDELAHVCAVRLWIAQERWLAKSTDQIASECKTYILELVQGGKLAPLQPENAHSLFDGSGSGGLQYMGHDSPAFQCLFKFLSEQRIEVFKASLAEQAKKLLADLQQDTDSFMRALTYINDEKPSNTFARTPILAFIKPLDFVAALLVLPARELRIALTFFRTRFDGVDAKSPRASEIKWLREVDFCFRQKANEFSPVRKSRLLRLHEETILVAVFNANIQEFQDDPNAQATEFSPESTASSMSILPAENG